MQLNKEEKYLKILPLERKWTCKMRDKDDITPLEERVGNYNKYVNKDQNTENSSLDEKRILLLLNTKAIEATKHKENTRQTKTRVYTDADIWRWEFSRNEEKKRRGHRKGEV